MKRPLVLVSVIGVACVLAAAPSAWTQETTSGSLAGRVLDAQNLAVPDVTVTVSSSQGARTYVSDSDGRFYAPYLTPGTYSVRAQLQGFRPVEQNDINLRLGQRLELTLVLTVGGLQEQVQVIASAPVIDTASTTAGARLESSTLNRLPVGRRFTDVLYVAPGVSSGGGTGSANASIGDRSLPAPAQLWARLQATLPPFTYTVQKDEIVQSDTDPRQKLRRVEVMFHSQVIDGKAWGHPAVIFMPADRRIYEAPDRRGKVVIVGQRSIDDLTTGPWRDSFLGNYGEPIAARTGYPTMILPVPGEFDDSPGREILIDFLARKVRDKGDITFHNYLRLAVPYLRGLDVFAGILHEKRIRAIIGGHSKRATSAFTAAAIDPERIVGVVYMGNEGMFTSLESGDLRALSPFHTQRFVHADVLYLGATNEDGYEMFNINRIQSRLEHPWTIEYIPNYRHADQSEKHFLDWQMWIAHVFDSRPLTRIGDLSYQATDEGTLFRARIESPNRIIQSKIWYVYCNDVPYWRDLVWYPEFMTRKGETLWEGYVTGKLPDAWLVEVKDIAGGYAAYLSSLPQDITHKPTKERVSRGSRSRLWEPKK